MRILFIFLIFCLSSCSFIQRQGVSFTGKLAYQGSMQIEKERNWLQFKEGVPANLKFLESLLAIDSENRELLASLVKGYSGYAFVVNETLLLQDTLEEKEFSQHKEQAVKNYSQAVRYGLKYLEISGITYKVLIRKIQESNGLRSLFDSHLDKESTIDLEVLF